ncbi:MAG: ester cyclase [Jiangellaceae bacterium]
MTSQAAGTTEQNKQLVRRLINEVMNGGHLDTIEEIYHPRLAVAARRWIEPFLNSFGDIHMRIDQLIAENDTVVGRFTCSGTHVGPWLGRPPTGRRFTNIAEVYIFGITDGRVTRAWGLEDTHTRLRQLGLGN